MNGTITVRAWSEPVLTSLVVFLFVSLAIVAPAAQDPNLILRNLAATGQAEAIRELLSEGEGAVVDSTDEAGWTALMHASDPGHDAVVRLLLDAGASVHLENNTHYTALHLAAEEGRTQVARLLLEAGADFSARDAGGRTPLFLAIARRHAEVIELLQTAALTSSSQRSPARTLALEGDTVPPVITQWTDAPYTDDALSQGIEGTVVLMAIVHPDGSIGAVGVSQGVNESLDRNAVRAVKTWRFDPATRAGNPVAVVVEINVEFELPEAR